MREQIRGARRDDPDGEVGTDEAVEATLYQAVPTPRDDQVCTCLNGVVDALRSLLALLHLVPKQVLDVLFGQT